jgi:hypothetical protein
MLETGCALARPVASRMCQFGHTSLIGASAQRNLSGMPATRQAKIKAEERMRELLESSGLPQPDEVEYGFWCVRFFFHETRTCVVIDLDPDAEDDADSPRSGSGAG